MKKTSFFFSLVLFAASMTPLAHAQLMPATSAGGQRAAAVKITPMSAADVTTIVNTGIGNGNVVIPSQEGPSGTFCGFGGRRTTTNPTYKTTEYTDASCMGASPVGSGVATYGNYQYVFACPQGYTQKTLSKDVTQTSGGGSGGSGWTNTTTTYLFTCIRN